MILRPGDLVFVLGYYPHRAPWRVKSYGNPLVWVLDEYDKNHTIHRSQLCKATLTFAGFAAAETVRWCEK